MQFQPSLLSYARSLQVGKGLFYSITKNEKNVEIKSPVVVEQITVRGSQSTHSAGQGYYDENPDKPNIQRIEMASLPANSEIFECRFSLNINSKCVSPDACNDEGFIKQMKEFIDTYAEKKGFEYLSKLYISQILNASWLWRNKDADDLEITICVQNRKESSFPLGNEKMSFLVAQKKSNEQELFLSKLNSEFAKALKEGRMLRLDIFAKGKIGFGQEIFPSQEFTEKSNSKGEVGRVLAKTKLETGEDQAYLHPQKIGNALRTIDTWYTTETNPLALPIEPYGVDSKMQKALRANKGKKIDFYTLIEKIYQLTEKIKNVKTAEDLVEEDRNAHFVMGCLIRGGVFSFTNPEKAEQKKLREAEKASKKAKQSDKIKNEKTEVMFHN